MAKTLEIRVDLDIKCSQCGKDGATQSGLCLNCVAENFRKKGITMAKTVKLTGKIKKVECVKGLDHLVIENLNFTANGLTVAKQCANMEESVEITITPTQENLPGTE